MRTLATKVTAALLAGGMAVGMTTPASAELADGPQAVLTTTNDQLAANTAPQDPNVTCAVEAGGRDIAQRTQYVVGEVYGQDFGVAEGECISLDTGRSYTCRVTVTIQYFEAGTWRNTPFSAASPTTDARSGVCVPRPPLAVGTYPGASPCLNRYHRAKGVLTTNIAGVAPRVDYSPVWFMFP